MTFNYKWFAAHSDPNLEITSFNYSQKRSLMLEVTETEGGVIRCCQTDVFLPVNQRHPEVGVFSTTTKKGWANKDVV